MSFIDHIFGTRHCISALSALFHLILAAINAIRNLLKITTTVVNTYVAKYLILTTPCEWVLLPPHFTDEKTDMVGTIIILPTYGGN